MFNIVLYKPEIPHNTGAIGRTCFATGAKLHLVHPLGFSLDEKSLRRAGMDYWPQAQVAEYANFADFLQKNPAAGTTANIFLAETGGNMTHADAKYLPNDYIIFGNESSGLPTEIINKYKNNVVTMPMMAGGRSLNLSVAAGIVLYEALRQNNFAGIM